MNIKKSLASMVLAATVVTGVTATPAEARNNHRNSGYYGDYGRSGYGYNNRDYNRDRYDNRGYRYDDNRNYRCKNNGTAGTVIGAVAGGLLGHEVAGRNSRTEGAIIGAAVGALAGRAIDKSDSNCRR